MLEVKVESQQNLFLEEEEGIRRLTEKRTLNGAEAKCLQYGGGGILANSQDWWTCVLDGKPEEGNVAEARITEGQGSVSVIQQSEVQCQVCGHLWSYQK